MNKQIGRDIAIIFIGVVFFLIFLQSGYFFITADPDYVHPFEELLQILAFMIVGITAPFVGLFLLIRDIIFKKSVFYSFDNLTDEQIKERLALDTYICKVLREFGKVKITVEDENCVWELVVGIKNVTSNTYNKKTSYHTKNNTTVKPGFSIKSTKITYIDLLLKFSNYVVAEY